MTFREGLAAHLAAIQRRDLSALAATLPADNRIVLVMADGKVVRSGREFLALHEGWFAGTTWKLGAEVVEAFEGADLGVAVLRLDYRDVRPSGEPFHEESVLTLTFRRDGDKWVMVHDQNTPKK